MKKINLTIIVIIIFGFSAANSVFGQELDGPLRKGSTKIKTQTKKPKSIVSTQRTSSVKRNSSKPKSFAIEINGQSAGWRKKPRKKNTGKRQHLPCKGSDCK